MAAATSATCFASIFDPCAVYVRPSSEAHCQGRQFGTTGKLSSSRNYLTASINSGSQEYRSNRAQDQWLGHTTWWPCRSAGEGLGFSSTKRRFSLHLSWQNQSIRSVHHSHFFSGSSARNARLWRAQKDLSSSDCTNDAIDVSRVPVYVMLPLDLLVFGDSKDMKLRRVKGLRIALQALKLAGVDGVTVDLWWGAVERHGPLVYDWSAYEDLFNMVIEAGLKAQVIMSFHACAESFNDNKNFVGLPLWITKIGETNTDIFYKDRGGNYSKEYLSLGVDEIPVLKGRTAVQCYEDFMCSFVKTFTPLLGSTIVKITIGLGPAGELRYPAHSQVDGRWRFPGIGEFQCYDKYMLADLQRAALDVGEPMWGYSGPLDAGGYNSTPWEVPFFQLQVGAFASDYGRFFLEWYSAKLIEHADKILSKAAKLLKDAIEDYPSRMVYLDAKLAGVHWWYRSHSHAAELTAGYYNTSYRDGYEPIAAMLAEHGTALGFPCIEMLDSEHPEYCFCSPEGLLGQVQRAAHHANIHVGVQNAIMRFDEEAFERVIYRSYNPSYPIHTFTFLRLGESLLSSRNWQNFVRFVKIMCSKSNGSGRPGSKCGDLCKSL